MAFFDGTTDLQEQSRTIVKTEDGIVATRVYSLDSVTNHDPEKVFDYLDTQGVDIGDEHPTISGIYLRKIQPEPHGQATGRVLVKFEWGPPGDDSELEDSNGEIREWDFSTRTIHITSVEQSGDQTHHPSSRSCGQAIGLHPDGVEGTDVYAPAGAMKITKRVSVANMTDSYREDIESANCKTNSGVFEGYNSREVLFLGASIQKSSSTHYTVVFNFLVGRSQGSRVVDLYDGGSTTVDPDPWDYVWFVHKSNISTGGAVAVQDTGIYSAHVAKTYDDTSFSVFDIGSDLT